MARDIGVRLRVPQVLILLIDQGSSTLEAVTYGATRALCDEAQMLGDAAFEAVKAVLTPPLAESGTRKR